ncbi:MAG TPA: phospholipase [Thermoanaerobaculia bacterium]|nr:phospholipase [Thermoanaerobaculia bacterium]
MLTANLAATVHGRYLYEERGEPLLVGFHGYAETADANMAELHRIQCDWSLLSIQALHRFYTRAGDVVASWMTSQDRELAIADNLSYVRSVLDAVRAPSQLVFSGFSQGAAMAARAAAHIPCDGLILLGGDVPPDVKGEDVRLPPVLVARGTGDEWYTDEKFKADLEWLEPRTRVTRCVFAGGHEWGEEFREAVAGFVGPIGPMGRIGPIGMTRDR